MYKTVKTHLPVRRISIIKSSDIRTIQSKKKSVIGGGENNLDDFNSSNLSEDIASFTDKLQKEYERGYADATAKIEQKYIELNKSTEQLRNLQTNKLIARISNEFDIIREHIEVVVPKLAVRVAEIVIRKQIQQSNDIIIPQIKDALHRIVGVEKVRLRISPFDEQIVRSTRPDLMLEVDSIHDLIIEIDDKVEQGGCIIESEMGNVDARLTTQLKQIEEALLEKN